MSDQALYRERAMCVALAVRLAQALGYGVGVANDDNTLGWPVVMIELPTGQVSWHFSAKDFAHCFPDGLPQPCYPFDGHTTEEKYRRCTQMGEADYRLPSGLAARAELLRALLLLNEVHGWMEANTPHEPPGMWGGIQRRIREFLRGKSVKDFKADSDRDIPRNEPCPCGQAHEGGRWCGSGWDRRHTGRVL